MNNEIKECAKELAVSLREDEPATWPDWIHEAVCSTVYAVVSGGYGSPPPTERGEDAALAWVIPIMQDAALALSERDFREAREFMKLVGETAARPSEKELRAWSENNPDLVTRSGDARLAYLVAVYIIARSVWDAVIDRSIDN